MELLLFSQSPWVTLSFVALALALLSAGWRPCRRPCRRPGTRQRGWYSQLPLPALLAALLALAAALVAGILQPKALPWLLLMLAVAVMLLDTSLTRRRPWLWLLLGALALAAALHQLPGLRNPLLVDKVQLSADSLPYTLYANFDKGWAGLCLLLALWPQQSPGGWV